MATTDPQTDESVENRTDESFLTRVKPGSWSVFVTALVMGLLIGGIAAWATLNIGIAPWAFIVGFLGGTWFLNRKAIPSEAIGSGLFVTALLLILTPILFYLPVIFGEGSGEGAEAAGAFIGGILGLLIWGFVFFLLAIVTAAVGYFFKRRAGKKLGTST